MRLSKLRQTSQAAFAASSFSSWFFLKIIEQKGQGTGSLVAAAAGGRGLEQRRGNCDIKTNISRGMIGFQTRTELICQGNEGDFQLIALSSCVNLDTEQVFMNVQIIFWSGIFSLFYPTFLNHQFHSWSSKTRPGSRREVISLSVSPAVCLSCLSVQHG